MTAILLPIFAVLIGFSIAIIAKPTINSSIKLLLSFSGAFLLAITIFEFLPEIYVTQNKEIGIYIIAGLLVQILLEFGSKGAEHGHTHQKNTTHFPWFLFISLCVHALIEGFPISENEHILYGIVVHKVPIAIIISSFLLLSKMKLWQSIIFIIVFALMTPLGSFINQQEFILESYKAPINAFVVGVLLHVSTTILFESSKNHQFNASKLGVILLGFIIAYYL
ncbi:ZIP family metal transporter [uncultured Dokdonia sp.]|uniref:ZIP family metal transporter n=1 Tax=uncultured Dokdonia sp. TaxID=575653 RepID=UPI00261A4E5F|nr:ZIP family metal transporter [uncultured Dokdonia sp.]